VITGFEKKVINMKQYSRTVKRNKEKNMNVVKGKKRLRIIFVTAVLALLVLACYSQVTYAAPATNSQAARSLLDPFSLNTIILTSAGTNGSSVLIARPQVRISTRPVVRSCFRPPIVTD
jgi:hypothetical protein